MLGGWWTHTIENRYYRHDYDRSSDVCSDEHSPVLQQQGDLSQRETELVSRHTGIEGLSDNQVSPLYDTPIALG